MRWKAAQGPEFVARQSFVATGRGACLRGRLLCRTGPPAVAQVAGARQHHPQSDDHEKRDEQRIVRVDEQRRQHDDDDRPDEQRRRVQNFHPVADDLHDDNSEREKDDAKQPWHNVAVVAVGEEKGEGEGWSEDQGDSSPDQVCRQIEKTQARSQHTVYIHA